MPSSVAFTARLLRGYAHRFPMYESFPDSPPLVYGYADVGRAGLGNMLLPWARCLLWCERHRVAMLPPRWLRLRIGPYLRRERDKRMYHRLFRAAGPLSVARRMICFSALPRRNEPRLGDSPGRPGVYIFRGMGTKGKFFAPLFGRHETIGRTLRSILKPELSPQPLRFRFVALHVRRGDFGVPSSDRVIRQGRPNYQIETGWYVRALRALRSGIGRPAPAIVFSDGNANDLADLLSEPETQLHPPVNAATDLLTMSTAAALVASGSSFSMWAGFLGQLPSLWHPGQRHESLVGDGTGSLEPEWDSGLLPNEFNAEIHRRLSLV